MDNTTAGHTKHIMGKLCSDKGLGRAEERRGQVEFILLARPGKCDAIILAANDALVDNKVNMPSLHSISKIICRYLLTRVITSRFSLRISGRTNLPPSGAVVLVANHASMADAFVIDRIVRRRSRYLVDTALYRHWYFPMLAWAYDVIPVVRGREFVAVRNCVFSLRKGIHLVIFPEGRLSETGHMAGWRYGAGMIAKIAGVPIVPIALVNTHEAWPPSTYVPRAKKIRVFIAPPIKPNDSSGHDMLTKAMKAVRNALND